MRIREHEPPASEPTPPGFEYRPQFHRDLESLEAEVTDMAATARRSLELSLEALDRDDLSLCESVIAGDAELNRRYRQIEARAVELIALQQPAAFDLRLLIALIHVSLHVERIGDLAVDVAEATRAAIEMPPHLPMLERLGLMGECATSMIGLAMEAFTKRDPQLVEHLGALDEEVDELNRQLISQVVACGNGEGQLTWAIKTLQVSRYLERAADHAVDIGEQAWFLTTGEFRELD